MDIGKSPLSVGIPMNCPAPLTVTFVGNPVAPNTMPVSDGLLRLTVHACPSMALPIVPATVGDAGIFELMTGTPAEVTVTVTSLVTVAAGADVVAPTVTVNVPLVVGVPVSWPLAALTPSVKPAGVLVLTV